MTYQNSTLKRKKGEHLSAIERGKIAGWLEEKLSNREIARRIGVHHTTIANELERGQLEQVRKINGIKHIYVKYNPEYAQNRYESKRQSYHRKSKFNQVKAFLAYFVEKFQTDDFSPDVAVGVAKSTGLFHLSEMVSTTILYKYIDEQRLIVRNIDLLHKVSRKNTQKRARTNKKILGKNIESRPEHVENREEFGHFEIDTVIGKRKGAETALLTITERKTRFEIIRLIDGKDADSVSLLDSDFTSVSLAHARLSVRLPQTNSLSTQHGNTR